MLDCDVARKRRKQLQPLARSLVAAGLLASLVGGGAAAPVFAQSAPPPAAAFYTCRNGATDTYTVPVGITHVFISATGGAGGPDSAGSDLGGLGALVEATVPVTPGDELLIIAGCGADGRHGGAGGDGLILLSGGDGGVASTYANGGGGGGASGVYINLQGHGPDSLIAGGGGGASGGAGLQSGNNGEAAGLRTANPQPTGAGGRGLGSTGGGGGGGGGSGNQGGAGGGGGGRLFAVGHSGDGGSSRVPIFATGSKVTKGGGPKGDGFVLLEPLPGVRPSPSMSYFNCQGGLQQAYSVPSNVNSLQVLVRGGAGSAGYVGAHAGRGASAQATLPVTPAQNLGIYVGCQGDTRPAFGSGGPGYGSGGAGGIASNDGETAADAVGRGGGGSSAIVDASQQPLVVAGGGGGAGGQGLLGSPGDGGNGSLAGDAGTRASNGGSGGAGGAGASGRAGDQGSSSTTCPVNGTGGGGGGGMRGGKGGDAGGCTPPSSGGGGGGGSSFLASGLSGSIAGGVSNSDGTVIIAAAVPGVPTAPTILQAVGATQQGTVTFTQPSDDGGMPITSYTVTSIPGGITVTGTSTTLTDTALTQRVPYTFTVHANNAIGKSAESGPSNPVTTIFAPGSPTNISVSGGDAQATVAFSPPADNGGRPVTRYTAIAHQGTTLNDPVIRSVIGTTSPIVVNGLTDGTQYTIGLLATNTVGDSIEGLAGSVVPLGLPTAPTGVSAKSMPGGISVSFNPPVRTGGAPIDTYTVTSTDGSVHATGTTSPILVTGLTNGLTYSFTVHATTRAGNGPESAPTVPIHWTSTTALGPPQLPNAVPGNQQATVSFLPPLDNGGSPVTSYTVTSNPGGITASGPASPITVTGLTDGVSYTFTVVAANANGTSQPSTVSNAVTPMVMVPDQPAAPVASASNQGAIVNITPPSSDGGSPITSYTVTSNPDGVIATATNTSIAVAGLTNGTSYTFSVVATNAVGNSLPSPASNAVTPSTAAPPLNDNFANAQVITGDTGVVSGTNVNATTEPGEPGSGGASVWYAWNVAHGGVVQMDYCNSNFIPLIAAYTGNAVDGLTPLPSGQVAVFCGTTNTFIASVQFTLPPNGGTIYFAVEGGIAPSGPVEGDFNLGWGQGGG
jgi:hypothetical protein